MPATIWPKNLYFTLDKPACRRLICVTNFIRENSCNPRLNESVGQAWQKIFEMKAQKKLFHDLSRHRDFHAACSITERPEILFFQKKKKISIGKAL